MTDKTHSDWYLNVKVGDLVRSYDFERSRDCYVEGVVEAVGEVEVGCKRYTIRCERRVFRGEEITPEDELFYPPVNGTPNLFGGTTKCVERI